MPKLSLSIPHTSFRGSGSEQGQDATHHTDCVRHVCVCVCLWVGGKSEKASCLTLLNHPRLVPASSPKSNPISFAQRLTRLLRDLTVGWNALASLPNRYSSFHDRKRKGSERKWWSMFYDSITCGGSTSFRATSEEKQSGFGCGLINVDKWLEGVLSAVWSSF